MARTNVDGADHWMRGGEKFVPAGRRNHHPGRVRYPGFRWKHKVLAPHGIRVDPSKMNEQQVISAALRLPPRKREKVAEVLLGTIKIRDQAHLNRLWAREAESRVDGFLDGKIRTIDGEKDLGYRSKK